MPKRKKAKNIQKEQPTHTPHPHHEKAPRSFHECPRSFAKTTIAHSKFLMCIDAKFPPTQQSTPKFHNTLKSKVSDYLKRPSEFPFTHEVRGFGLSNDPTHPRSLWGSLIASKIRYLSREKFTPWGLDRPPPAPPRTGGNPSVCVPKNA